MHWYYIGIVLQYWSPGIVLVLYCLKKASIVHPCRLHEGRSTNWATDQTGRNEWSNFDWWQSGWRFWDKDEQYWLFSSNTIPIQYQGFSIAIQYHYNTNAILDILPLYAAKYVFKLPWVISSVSFCYVWMFCTST